MRRHKLQPNLQGKITIEELRILYIFIFTSDEYTVLLQFTMNTWKKKLLKNKLN